MAFHTDQILRYLLKGIIVADHEKLAETPNIHHLAGQRFSADVAQRLFELDLAKVQRELSEVLPQADLDGLAFRVQKAREYLRALRRSAPQDSLL